MYSEEDRLLRLMIIVAALTAATGGIFNFKKKEKPKIITGTIPVIDLGLPEEFKKTGKCELDEESIKRIKFKALGDGEEEVTVTPRGRINVYLTVLYSFFNEKKYVFSNNSSEDIVIKRGDASVILRAKSKTGFMVDGEKLKEREYGYLGLPKDFEIFCCLWEDDLLRIEFSEFEGVKGKATITPYCKNIISSLFVFLINQEEGKYIFGNYAYVYVDSEETKKLLWLQKTITISKGNASITIEGNMETEFTLENGKLKKEVRGAFGLPRGCDNLEGAEAWICKLGGNDLKKIKFKDMGIGPDVNLSSDENITLMIQRTSDENYPDGKKYIFKNDIWGKKEVLIQKSLDHYDYKMNLQKERKKIIFKRRKYNIFRKNGDYLEEVI